MKSNRTLALAWLAALLLAACGRAASEAPAGTAGPGPTAVSPAVSPTLAETTEAVTPGEVGAATAPVATATSGLLPDTSRPEAAFPPAPDCQGDLALTPPNSEGPYYTPDTPERNSLREEGIPGTPLIVAGYVLTPDCQPVAGVKLDFWQTDGNGVYDNSGYRLRGHQFTDAEGRYYLETVVPGAYPGRPPHIHVKVQAPGGPELTTQLYFPEGSVNESDGIFDPELLVDLQETPDGLLAHFNFVVEPG